MNRLMDETQKWVKDFMKAGEKVLADLQDSSIVLLFDDGILLYNTKVHSYLMTK